MKQKEAYVRDTLVNVQQFLDVNAAALGPVNTSGARTALDDAITALDEHAVAQGEHRIRSTGETNRQRSLRRSLRKQYLRPIAQVAAASLGNAPEIASLRLPSDRLVGSRLVDAANAMANAAEPYLAVFIAAGLRADVLDGLRAMTHAMQTSLGGRSDHVIKRRGSTIALSRGVASGRIALRLLDAVIEQQLPDNTQLLAEWKAVKRIRKKPGATPIPASGASVAARSPRLLRPPTTRTRWRRRQRKPRAQPAAGARAEPEQPVSGGQHDGDGQRVERAQVQHAPVGARQGGHEREHGRDAHRDQQDPGGAQRVRPGQGLRDPAQQG